MAPSRVSPPPAAQEPAEKYGDFRDEFFHNGFVVIKNAVPRERALEYQNSALSWLEGFHIGFDRNDTSTWKKENLPQSWKGGMYLHFSAAHEKYVWDARCEPGVIEPFAKLWGTKELLVSFDTVNITLPPSIVGEYDSKAWPHCDQAPERRELSCVQGIINLSQAGPDDGGLLVMKGSAPLFDQFFREHPPTGRENIQAKHKDFFPFTEENLEWYKAHGCELMKVCAEPGDLILWDSRQVHWAKFADSDTVRTLIYACYTPAAWATPEDLEVKKEFFQKFKNTTHWPHCNLFTHGGATITVDGNEVPDPLERAEPVEKPILTDQVQKLAGVIPY